MTRGCRRLVQPAQSDVGRGGAKVGVGIGWLELDGMLIGVERKFTGCGALKGG